ncbi:sensor histidine kinase N-terminal domain-containing protein [Aquincola sp. S2]|uniref:histidine kinase n=1 Tax=Pseudaquabacterium terrae TaxID=2732868 RepID=A0ABX2EGW5_9BURK|nr:sensor histidine kinase N-terminal domain-containing protein [Aquabacterium terrae]
MKLAPTSIRARLLLSLLVALALAICLVGVISYRNVLEETEALFDYQLRQMALSLRDQGEIAGGDAAALQDEDLDFVIQIWHVDGRSVYASRKHRALPSRTVLGFADIAVDGQAWRSFGVAARDRVIQVAQPVRIRQRLAANAALRSVLPLVAVTPLLAAALWWLIAHSLQPLSRLAKDVRGQAAERLAPVNANGLPDEVEPLVVALNGLLERLGQAFDSQRAFVADAAHELRSPLTALKLQAQLVRRAPDEAARHAALDALVAGVDRATRLVEQLLTLARQEQPAEQQTVVLAPLARQVLADLGPQAQARGSTLQLDADEQAAVRGDAASLAVLLRNLVDNALRYAPAGGEVRVELKREGRGVLLRVDDSGPGIPEAERERVFERFVRGSSASAESGSGLGLAIVRSIAGRHGARLQLAQAPLGGLRVELTFAQA